MCLCVWGWVGVCVCAWGVGGGQGIGNEESGGTEHFCRQHTKNINIICLGLVWSLTEFNGPVNTIKVISSRSVYL